MRERRGLWTALVAVVLLAAGFAVGGAGAAWLQREQRSEPWRKMRLEHEGTEGVTTRTRVVFANPALALQAIDLTRSPEGVPELSHVALRDGKELTVRYQKDRRPSTLEAPDGSRALISYEQDRARVDFFAADKKALGSKAVTIPAELRPALLHARAESEEARGAEWAWAESLIPEARAQEADDQVAVVRYLELRLDTRVPNGTEGGAGVAQVDASCPPLACVPVTADAAMPGKTTLRIAVSGKAKRSELKKPSGDHGIESFKQTAIAERKMAKRVLPDLAAVVAAIGVTASACKSLRLSGPLCVSELAKATVAGAAARSIKAYDVPTQGAVVDARAEELYYIDQARATLERELHVQVCLSRDGYIRPCVDVTGRPFAPQPMAPVERSVEMRRGIGGALAGSFILSQQDGADCKFSPSPQTTGALRMTFDNERNTLTAALRADQRGARPNLRCSLGTANMSWSQTYTVTASQTFTAQQLQAGGKLPLRLTGTMNGVGSYSFSNCRTSGGASAGCPAGKSDGYAYPVELIGDLDLGTQTGSGRIVVSNAPLDTSGTWRVPAGDKP